jgi:hypothetical protein
LARAGDSLAAAFAFFAERDYRAFTLSEPLALLPATELRDGDFWFFPAEDQLLPELGLDR